MKDIVSDEVRLQRESMWFQPSFREDYGFRKHSQLGKIISEWTQFIFIYETGIFIIHVKTNWDD